MSFATNYAGNAYTDGVQLSAGNKRHVFLRQFVNGLLSFLGGSWEEVTGSSPTPAGLQTYASTISGSVTNATDPVQGSHITIYYADDPLIGSGDSRLVRFIINDYDSNTDWLKVQIMDSAALESFTAIDGASTQGISATGGWGFGTGITQTCAHERRLLLSKDDDWFSFFVFDTDSAEAEGGAVIMVPASVDMYSRGAGGYIFAVATSDYTLGSLTNYGMATSSGGTDFAGSYAEYLISTTPSLDTISELSTTEDGSFMLSPLAFIKRGTYPGFVTIIPRVRVIRSNAVTSLMEFDVGDRTFVALNIEDGIGNSSDAFRWCIEVTPEAT